mmetsp:Transcript_19750/g.31631  ORF Transcript_19750/g.31631 Transcript_19750/m.31631 type:complete len:169 (-) Transcript_19750:214-720(-)|eukprot:CAMPEP_0179457562 /NCGR_PEP_ID=MMETSP0799-20121207/41317_1 /TAXON_ID=46947 /ORGANISM="Geminigera cryophila, Strain CCMP2564" /LENGTH=168 /DNA_ID=CAMNT_0021258347 /DNA_START=101 /DNA_END=607 /DNA_ORIENTATION=+
MASVHGKPEEGAECLATYEDLDETNYVEYQTMPSGKWHAAKFNEDVTQTFLRENWANYLRDVAKAAADCAAAVRRIVTKGPPMWLEDKHGYPVPEGDTHISAVWYMSSGTETSAKIEGCFEGEEREIFWNGQKETLAQMEVVEASDKSPASPTTPTVGIAAMTVSDTA